MKLRGHTKGTTFSHENAACAFTREVLTRVGDKWSVLVVALLGDGAKRFNELKRMIDGISQRMLTLTLRGLERDGLVARTVFPTVPPRVEYALTPLGGTLLKTLTELANWATDNRDAISQARDDYDRRETIPYNAVDGVGAGHLAVRSPRPIATAAERVRDVERPRGSSRRDAPAAITTRRAP